MDGDRLRKLRKKRKLTQAELGKILNVSKVSISGYETGIRTPDTDNLKRLADFFGVTSDYLLGRSDDPRLTEDQQKEVDEEFQELKKIIESLPEEEQEKVKRMVIGYVKGYADSLDRKENKRSE